MKGFMYQKWGRVRLRQSGASALEFALVFPMLMLLSYSAVVYGYVYMLQQSINFAAQQASQAAVAVLPGTAASTTTQSNLIKQTVDAALAWLPAGQLTGRVNIPVPATSNCTNTYTAALTTTPIVVEVDFKLSGLFPVLINLPFIGGTVPVLPANLFACAVAFP
jgi:Flp pilus assembly protein TadG